jgi:tetratricopeptide (TPR) repeat protein
MLIRRSSWTRTGVRRQKLITAVGDAYFHLGALGDAIVDYDAALKRYPDYWEALYGRGVVKLRKGDTAGGKADIEAAVKLHPGAAVEERKRGIAP